MRFQIDENGHQTQKHNRDRQEQPMKPGVSCGFDVPFFSLTVNVCNRVNRPDAVPTTLANVATPQHYANPCRYQWETVEQEHSGRPQTSFTSLLLTTRHFAVNDIHLKAAPASSRPRSQIESVPGAQLPNFHMSQRERFSIHTNFRPVIERHKVR